MSRRQRKNVKKREKDSETNSNPTNVCAQDQNVTKNQKKRNSLPSKFHVSLGLSDDQIYYHLLNYILDQDTLRSLGFPLESQLSPGKAWVYQDPEFRGGTNNFVFDDEQTVKSSCLDVNAREFVPKNLMLEDEAAASGDDVASTHSSNSLSASAKEFIPSKLPV